MKIVIFINMLFLCSVVYSDRLPDIQKAFQISHKTTLELVLKDYVRSLPYADRENPNKAIVMIQGLNLSPSLEEMLQAVPIRQDDIAKLFHKDPSADVTNLVFQAVEMAQKLLSNKAVIVKVTAHFPLELAHQRLGFCKDTAFIVIDSNLSDDQIEQQLREACHNS